jgi:hypothetical protein
MSPEASEFEATGFGKNTFEVRVAEQAAGKGETTFGLEAMDAPMGWTAELCTTSWAGWSRAVGEVLASWARAVTEAAGKQQLSLCPRCFGAWRH